MTCRHQLGDPNCTAGKSPDALRRKAITDYQRWVGPIPTGGRTSMLLGEGQATTERVPETPDSMRYTVLDIYRSGKYVALKVEYPNCALCSYEGVKVMVFEADEKDIINWRKIDPHFRDPSAPRDKAEAPPPLARFPANTAGWFEARDYASRRNEASRSR